MNSSQLPISSSDVELFTPQPITRLLFSLSCETSGEKWEAWKAFFVAGFPAQKMVFLPAGASKDAMVTYQKAFEAIKFRHPMWLCFLSSVVGAFVRAAAVMAVVDALNLRSSSLSMYLQAACVVACAAGAWLHHYFWSQRPWTLIIADGLSEEISYFIAAFVLQFDSRNRYEQLLDTSVELEKRVTDTSYHFKSQVQEWKNVLLRGHDEADRRRYWQQFVAEEAQVHDARLLPSGCHCHGVAVQS